MNKHRAQRQAPQPADEDRTRVVAALRLGWTAQEVLALARLPEDRVSPQPSSGSDPLHDLSGRAPPTRTLQDAVDELETLHQELFTGKKKVQDKYVDSVRDAANAAGARDGARDRAAARDGAGGKVEAATKDAAAANDAPMAWLMRPQILLARLWRKLNLVADDSAIETDWGPDDKAAAATAKPAAQAHAAAEAKAALGANAKLAAAAAAAGAANAKNAAAAKDAGEAIAVGVAADEVGAAARVPTGVKDEASANAAAGGAKAKNAAEAKAAGEAKDAPGVADARGATAANANVTAAITNDANGNPNGISLTPTKRPPTPRPQ